jgi:hypothetical protein
LLRRKYKEVRGKKVDWVNHVIEDGWLFFMEFARAND